MANAYGRQLKSVQPRAVIVLVGGCARQDISIIFAEMHFRRMNKRGEGEGEIARDTLQTVSGSSTLARKVSRDGPLGLECFSHDVSASRVIPQENKEMEDMLDRNVILRQFGDYTTSGCSTSERFDTPRRSRGAVLPRKGERFLASGGLLFPGRIIQLPGGQIYAGKVGEQIGDRRGAVVAVVAAARDGRRSPKRTGQRAS
ncbi:hypothetical protein G5I_01111 [Acromyrmex echinatior]|uniref:Uncharacterized protein n=1 Tax=Acromyrmex echinatior TaxID=103372 RepID=F4W6L6_ACREC|nr:hypothetical protein G5I_01111 [Acromyrmex echinatior]